jgi:stage V sporulation protein AD
MITEYMPGRIVDGATSDGANMGGAMAFAAFDSITAYFEESGESVRNIDYIVTGDLGKVGSDILKELLAKEIPGADRLHTDCGLLLYDFQNQDAHSGASGCGTSASVLACHFLPLINEGKVKNILFLSTGALMSPSSLLQGENIYGIAPLIRLEYGGN